MLNDILLMFGALLVISGLLGASVVLTIWWFVERRKPTAKIRVWALTHRGKQQKEVGVILNRERNIYHIEFEGYTIYVGVDL